MSTAIPATNGASVTPAVVPPVLQLTDFRVSFPTLSGAVQAVRGIDLVVNAGELVAVVGESGSGKSVTFLGLMGLLPRARLDRAGRRSSTASSWSARREDGPPAARPADGDDLPGSAVGAQPGAPHRPPDRRDDPLAPGHEQEARRGAGRRAARPRRHPPAEGAGAAVPPRVLRRHAPAGDDRHGDRQRPRRADRRRADHRARRHRAGPDPRGHPADPARAEHGRGADHPRPRRGRPRRRAGAGDVRRPAPSSGRRSTTLFADPTHPYTVGLLHSLPAPRAEERLHPIRGRAAEHARPPSGCAFRPRCAVRRPVLRRRGPRAAPYHRVRDGVRAHRRARPARGRGRRRRRSRRR